MSCVSLLLIAVAAFSATLLAIPPLRRRATQLGLLDHPNARSSHNRATARVGGLALVAGLGAGLALHRRPWLDRPDLVAVLVGALLVALVGLVDDRMRLPPWPRLVVHGAAALLVVRSTGGWDRVAFPAPLEVSLGALGPLLSVLWIVTLVNFFNFMDGIDGLAGLQGLITAGALGFAAGWADGATAVAVALAAGCAAFLLFNWSPASVFLGDAGSGLVGFTLASLPMVAPTERRFEAMLLVAASLVFFLSDASICLLRRMRAGERWYEAHRQHLYQRWVHTGASHAAVTAWLGAGTAVTTALALAGWQAGEPEWYWASLVVGAALVLAEWAAVSRSERRAAEAARG